MHESFLCQLECTNKRNGVFSKNRNPKRYIFMGIVCFLRLEDGTFRVFFLSWELEEKFCVAGLEVYSGANLLKLIVAPLYLQDARR
jgi:hypothetical protein